MASTTTAATTTSTKKNSFIKHPEEISLESLPKKIKSHIFQSVRWEIVVNGIYLKNRHIHLYLYFFTESKPTSAQIWSSYLTKILMWLHIVSNYAPKHCSQSLSIFFFLTLLEKQLPNNNAINNALNNAIVNAEHVNTAFTFSCKPKNEIVLFRKEEWLKVFLHETFHAFGLDFSSMDCRNGHAFIQRNLFSVSSEVNVFEAYTEFWAEMWNIGFCAFFEQPTKKEYFSLVAFFLQLEQQFSCFQLVKTLNYMRLTYNELCNVQSAKTRHLYKEKSSVLSYYIIKTILISACDEFLQWSFQQNGYPTAFVFHLTARNVMSFCVFLQHMYRSPKLLKCIDLNEQKWRRLLNTSSSSTSSFSLNDLLKNTMRMSVCELE
jgi:hypothetical protein